MLPDYYRFRRRNSQQFESGSLETVRNTGITSMTQYIRLEEVVLQEGCEKVPDGNVFVFIDKLNSSYQYMSMT